MRTVRQIRRALERFGVDVKQLKGEEAVHTKALIQPMRYKNKMFLDGQITPIGEVDESCFLYIGLPVDYLKEHDTTSQIFFQDKAFIIVKMETIYFGDQPAYTWAILRLLYQEV